MANNKKINNLLNAEAKEKKDLFLDKLKSDMLYNSDYSSNSFSFDWLDLFEYSCPFIDNVVRFPKIALIKEEITVPVERSKKITSESIKDLTKHPNYISNMDISMDDVEVKKILNVLSEETYNIYENRFLYTLINDMDNFIYEKELLLKNFEFYESKFIEYKANSITGGERVNIALRIDSQSFPIDKPDKKMAKKFKDIKLRIKRVKDFINSWERGIMYKNLVAEHVSFVKPPIKKTNVLLKNPNFQVALSLYEFLHKIDDNETLQSNLKTDLDPLQGFLDHAFLINFFVLDSISRTKTERRKKMGQYAILMLKEEIHRTLDLLKSIGIEISDEELLKLIADELKKEPSTRLVGAEDVKNKFMSAIDEYLERTQGNL